MTFLTDSYMGITQHINFIIQIIVFKLKRSEKLIEWCTFHLYDIVKILKSVGEYYVIQTIQPSILLVLRRWGIWPYVETCNHLKNFTNCFMKVWNNWVKVLDEWHHIIMCSCWKSNICMCVEDCMVLWNSVTFVVKHAKPGHVGT